MTRAQRFHLMTAPVGNGFNGEIRGVQLSIADDPNHSGHLVKPEDAINAAMGRQSWPSSPGLPPPNASRSME